MFTAKDMALLDQVELLDRLVKAMQIAEDVKDGVRDAKGDIAGTKACEWTLVYDKLQAIHGMVMADILASVK